MHAISIKRTWYGALLALIFFGVGLAEASPGIRGYSPRSNIESNPWNSIRWLTNYATVFTTAGLGWLTTKIDESVQTPGGYVGWGTGTHTAVIADTALTTEDTGGSPTYARVDATRSIVTTTKTNDTVQYVSSITSNGTKTIKEAATFTASTSGTMLIYGDFTGIDVLVNDIIQFTFKLQFTN